MSYLGEKSCFIMHRFNLSMHILHVFVQEFERFLNLYCSLGAMQMPGWEARPELNTNSL